MAALQGLCLLITVLFAVAVERAWEFVGAKMPGLLGTSFGSARRRALIVTAPGGHADQNPPGVG